MQITKNKLRHCCRTALLCAFMANMPNLVHATDIYDLMPRPGLYRIDLDGTLMNPSAEVSAGMRIQTDGATGDTVAQGIIDGTSTYSRRVQGDRPATECIAPYPKGPAADAAAMQALANMPLCSNQTTVYTKDGYIHKATCSTSHMVLTVKKIDRDVWDFVIETTQFQSAQGPDLRGMKFVLENAVKNAPSAKERADAAKKLAALPDMQNKMSQAQALTIKSLQQELRQAKSPEVAAMIKDALARMTGQAPTLTSVSKQRKTRIADTCNSAS
jgi:hypothetical protein